MYGSKKCGTHARVFSQTLEHGNSKHETNGTKEGKKTEVSMDKSKEVTKRKSPNDQTIAQAYRPLEVATPQIIIKIQ